MTVNKPPNDSQTDARKTSCLAVGAGPSNLSLGALAQPLANIRVRILERQQTFRWHPGMQIEDSELQVSYLKDLVTLVDPTSRFSFLSFLKEKRRLYYALVANRERTSRREFEQYLSWVANSLGSVSFNSEVEEMSFDGAQFNVRTRSRTYPAQHVVVGIGRSAKFPPIPNIRRMCTHSSEYMNWFERSPKNHRVVAVVGGGQSGVEIVSHLLTASSSGLRVIWISRRPNLLPLDDSPFVNEQFHPHYAEYFTSLKPEQRKALNNAFRYTSDGISVRTLSKLYRQIYDLRCTRPLDPTPSIHLGTEFIHAEPTGDGYRLWLRDVLTGHKTTETCSDMIMATGYDFSPPEFLTNFLDVSSGTAKTPLKVRDSRSIVWNGPVSNKIFLQNGFVEQFGLIEPNLSLLAWRSAKVINEIAGRQVYELAEDPGALSWRPEPENPEEGTMMICVRMATGAVHCMGAAPMNVCKDPMRHWPAGGRWDDY